MMKQLLVCLVVLVACRITEAQRRPRPKPGCSVDADCTKPNSECSGGYCKPKQCASDSDCTDGAVCVSKDGTGYCLPPPRGYCTADSDCTAINANRRCVDNFCKPANCSDNSDCVDGAICLTKDGNGYCLPPPRGYCEVDANCTAVNANRRCVDNFCKPANCSDNSDCVDGAVCLTKDGNGYCLPPPRGYCEVDANCTSANLECLDNFCKPINCTTSSDCVDGFECKVVFGGSMKCVPPRTTCTTSDDCSQGERCVRTRRGRMCKSRRG